MTPDQINTWTDAALQMQTMADTFGPGITLTVGTAAAWWASRRAAAAIHDRLAHRRDVRRGLRRLQQYANPDGNRQLLDDMHQPRKENP